MNQLVNLLAEEAKKVILEGNPPEIMMVAGHLKFDNEWPAEARWPDRLIVEGDFRAFNLETLSGLPRELVTSGRMEVHHNPQLAKLPEHMISGQSMEIINCPKITELAGETKASGLLLIQCEDLAAVERVMIWGDVLVSECPKLPANAFRTGEASVAGMVNRPPARSGPGEAPPEPAS